MNKSDEYLKDWCLDNQGYVVELAENDEILRKFRDWIPNNLGHASLVYEDGGNGQYTWSIIIR